MKTFLYLLAAALGFVLLQLIVAGIDAATTRPWKRVDQAASAAGLGARVANFEVNGTESAFHGSVMGLLSMLLAVGVCAYFPLHGLLVEAGGLSPERFSGVLVLLGAVTVAAWWLLYHRKGTWQIHRFESGFVMERTRGAVAAVPYSAVSARVFRYSESHEGGNTGYIGLELTLPDGKPCAMSVVNDDGYAQPTYAKALRALAQACGASADDAAKLSERAAGKLLKKGKWRG
jgi:hypothetical protein